GRRRDHDLRAADGPPTAPEDPVDRDQEEAVQRLRVRGRLTRNEAKRPVMYERLREVVALVGERRENASPFVEEDGQARGDRRDGDQPEVNAFHRVATSTGASTCPRTQSSSINRHHKRCPWSARPVSWSSSSRRTVPGRNQPRSLERRSCATSRRSDRNQRPSGTPKPALPRPATSTGRSAANARRSATFASRPRFS